MAHEEKQIMNPFNTDLIRLTLSLTSLVGAVGVYVVLRQAIVRLPIHPDQKRRARKTSAYGAILALLAPCGCFRNELVKVFHQ